MLEKTSVEYLNRLLNESGKKISSQQKLSAMQTLIELLDEDLLNGLLGSIRKDYENARRVINERQNVVERRKKRLTSLKEINEKEAEQSKLYSELRRIAYPQRRDKNG